MKALLAFSAALTGLSALSLAMDRHHEDCRGRGRQPAPALRRGLQAAGVSALLLSLWAAIASHGSAQGWVFWFGAMTAAALAVVLTLAYVPRRAMALLRASASLALVCALVSLAGAA